LNYWGEHEKDKIPDTDTFFSLDTDTFDKYPVDVTGGILGFNKAEAVALLWRTTYI